MTDWTSANSAAALAEGWDIFDCAGDTPARPFQLQRWDEAEKFEDDAAAWRHVRARAATGSGLHVAALAFLAAQSPAEHAAIMQEIAP